MNMLCKQHPNWGLNFPHGLSEISFPSPKLLEVDRTLYISGASRILSFPKVYSKREIWKRKGNTVHNAVSQAEKNGE